ncbi:IS110 family transposase [Streptomyces sp. NPDC088801]|uniref:IS110 family transposase n=1 Tax=Streptomyces sp. NPDC088801 TaxID=3365903 RepID=UPI0038182432
MILIGIDPHKSSHTAVAVDAAGHQVAQRRFVVNAGTFRQLMRWCEQWPDRRFAVEGAGGLGRSLAQQLAAAGENVVDVPSTLSARARLLATGGDRKTDAKDALHVAQVALFRHDLRPVVQEDQTTILRLLTERRDDLVHERTLLADLRRLDRQVKDNEAEMREAIAATRSTLTTLPGLGTVLAAKVLGHIGNISRFPTEHHFASYTGSAPLDASSGNNVRHRLNTGGNRALNSVLHTIAVCQIRDGGRGQDYYLRKISEGKTPSEARRALKRRLSNVVYRIMKRDEQAHLAQAA